MKQSSRSYRMPHAVLPGLLAWVTLATLAGCSGGKSEPGVGIQGVTQAAPRLSDFNDKGEYDPYYATGDMQRPRYMHELILSKKGLPIAFGGSDERGYSGIDTVEIYDQSTFDKDAPKPESQTGLWIDTNFEGDPMTFENGPRMRFTVTLLADGRVIVIGGGPDLTRSSLYDQVEVFDAETRKFETLDEKMLDARFRHVAITLNDGNILVIGGQIETTVTIIDDRIPEGFPGRQSQQVRFVTTNTSEFFSPREQKFLPLTFPDSDKKSLLKTPRGRSGHAVNRLAGPDGLLSTADDLLLIAGGFQGLSGQFAPDSKFPGTVLRGQADGLTVIEFFDPQTKVFTQVGNVNLNQTRINDPYIVNLGLFNDLTPDGVRGMGNCVLITHGNDDASPCTVLEDDMLLANYTGFGPAQGLQFFRIVDDQFPSHSQGCEYFPPPPLIDARANQIGRCGTNPVALPRALVTAPSVPNIETWIVSVAGVDIVPTPAGCVESFSPTVLSGCVFDPFYSLPAIQLGLSARDLKSQRSQNNPLGVIGCWLTLDGALPTVDLTNFGSTSPARWARPTANMRVFGKHIAVAGEDGIPNTTDDRILLSGGGLTFGDPNTIGGEPSSPSSEILITPGSLSKVPSP